MLFFGTDQPRYEAVGALPGDGGVGARCAVRPPGWVLEQVVEGPRKHGDRCIRDRTLPIVPSARGHQPDPDPLLPGNHAEYLPLAQVEHLGQPADAQQSLCRGQGQGLADLCLGDTDEDGRPDGQVPLGLAVREPGPGRVGARRAGAWEVDGQVGWRQRAAPVSPARDAAVQAGGREQTGEQDAVPVDPNQGGVGVVEASTEPDGGRLLLAAAGSTENDLARESFAFVSFRSNVQHVGARRRIADPTLVPLGAGQILQLVVQHPHVLPCGIKALRCGDPLPGIVPAELVGLGPRAELLKLGLSIAIRVQDQGLPGRRLVGPGLGDMDGELHEARDLAQVLGDLEGALKSVGLAL